MKQRILKILILIETLIIVSAVLWSCFVFVNSKKTELLRETSPDGDYLLIIQEMGTPDWPFGADHLNISLYEQKADPKYRVSFQADVSNDGCTADYEIEWLEDSVQIALIGSEQPTAYYVLPFKTLNENTGISEDIENAVTLDDKRVIQDQSFNIELEEWGNVGFVSYLPSEEVYMEDVSFFLTKENQVIYSFPYYCKSNSTENYIGLFDSVEAVGFQDVNRDGLQDVIVIINYVTGAGPQGMLPRRVVRIFIAEKNGFVLAEDLMHEINANLNDEELTLANIYKYIDEHK